ncbi:hypothetical protein JR316_0005929 [Psilocybe cubensis]|uniref:SHSP domain-containing protein n=2 Tax=Psilocybe cubensis TaxID=181762 RepID=A0A8H8CLU2_PSICU|nr:hypothetical protein JR316_0005929 [Psilocybe cubensis]KAH9481403.1 hypothetical protein JR316_0005929 [Psilocybe cubensis]
MPAHIPNRKDDKGVSSPLSPAVTGIDYPSVDDASTELDMYRHRGMTRGLYTHPNIAGSSIEDVEPPADARSLTLVWDSIRQEKEKKMAKERPKVQSLEEVVQELYAADHVPMQIPLMESPPISAPKSVRKQKSISTFRESTDGRAIVATFDLPEVAKQDIHISFQRNKLVLTWESGEITEWEEEDGVVLREHVRKMFHRTLPLPEGTRFEEIHAQMTSKGLILRYPNMRCYRVDARSRSGDS